MAYSEEQIKILEGHNYVQYVDRCLFCEHFDRVQGLCESIDIRVSENGHCSLFSIE